MDNTKIKMVGVVIAVILVVAVAFNYWEEQDIANKKAYFESEEYLNKLGEGVFDLGLTPDEFKNAYDNLYISEPKIIQVKNQLQSTMFTLDNNIF